VPTVFPPAGPSAVDSDRTAGNLGLGVLGRFRLVTDFAGDRLWLGAGPVTTARSAAASRSAADTPSIEAIRSPAVQPASAAGEPGDTLWPVRRPAS
jgi:hypothetical protein